MKREILDALVKFAAWVLLWFFRTVIGAVGFGMAAFVVYSAYRDWPTPLYALLIVIGVYILIFAGVAIYIWAYERLNPPPQPKDQPTE